MLIMKKAEFHEIPVVEDILREYNMQELNEIQENIEYTIAYDNQSAIAAAGISYYQEYGILRFIAVKRDYQKQGIGDGILRAALNAADHNGIKWVFCHEKCAQGFLEKIGFQRMDEDEINRIIGETYIEQLAFGLKIPEFFLKGCKAKKRG